MLAQPLKKQGERESRSAGDGALVVPPSVNLSGKKSKEKKQQKGKRQTHNFDCGQHILINASAERARKAVGGGGDTDDVRSSVREREGQGGMVRKRAGSSTLA